MTTMIDNGGGGGGGGGGENDDDDDDVVVVVVVVEVMVGKMMMMMMMMMMMVVVVVVVVVGMKIVIIIVIVTMIMKNVSLIMVMAQSIKTHSNSIHMAYSQNCSYRDESKLSTWLKSDTEYDDIEDDSLSTEKELSEANAAINVILQEILTHAVDQVRDPDSIEDKYSSSTLAELVGESLLYAFDEGFDYELEETEVESEEEDDEDEGTEDEKPEEDEEDFILIGDQPSIDWPTPAEASGAQVSETPTVYIPQKLSAWFPKLRLGRDEEKGQISGEPPDDQTPEADDRKPEAETETDHLAPDAATDSEESDTNSEISGVEPSGDGTQSVTQDTEDEDVEQDQSPRSEIKFISDEDGTDDQERDETDISIEIKDADTDDIIKESRFQPTAKPFVPQNNCSKFSEGIAPTTAPLCSSVPPKVTTAWKSVEVPIPVMARWSTASTPSQGQHMRQQQNMNVGPNFPQHPYQSSLPDKNMLNFDPQAQGHFHNCPTGSYAYRQPTLPLKPPQQRPLQPAGVHLSQPAFGCSFYRQPAPRQQQYGQHQHIQNQTQPHKPQPNLHICYQRANQFQPQNQNQHFSPNQQAPMQPYSEQTNQNSSLLEDPSILSFVPREKANGTSSGVFDRFAAEVIQNTRNQMAANNLPQHGLTNNQARQNLPANCPFEARHITHAPPPCAPQGFANPQRCMPGHNRLLHPQQQAQQYSTPDMQHDVTNSRQGFPALHQNFPVIHQNAQRDVQRNFAGMPNHAPCGQHQQSSAFNFCAHQNNPNNRPIMPPHGNANFPPDTGNLVRSNSSNFWHVNNSISFKNQFI
ncbi:PAX-interacting protein 1-like [Ptychodera flava]|uniref:PAX-interacting protein 1-like n=1 Tax=Ptychodera flava TaxID=63121 RepID=UPI003969C2F1